MSPGRGFKHCQLYTAHSHTWSSGGDRGNPSVFEMHHHPAVEGRSAITSWPTLCWQKKGKKRNQFQHTSVCVCVCVFMRVFVRVVFAFAFDGRSRSPTLQGRDDRKGRKAAPPHQKQDRHSTRYGCGRLTLRWGYRDS